MGRRAKHYPVGRRKKAPLVREGATTVGVRELRQNLSVYLDYVKSGRTLTVTEHGQEVAILRPMPAIKEPIARLIAEGKATPAKRSPRDLPPPLPPIPGAKPLGEILDELREERLP